jgi:hypothetical protein
MSLYTPTGSNIPPPSARYWPNRGFLVLRFCPRLPYPSFHGPDERPNLASYPPFYLHFRDLLDISTRNGKRGPLPSPYLERHTPCRPVPLGDLLSLGRYLMISLNCLPPWVAIPIMP